MQCDRLTMIAQGHINLLCHFNWLTLNLLNLVHGTIAIHINIVEVSLVGRWDVHIELELFLYGKSVFRYLQIGIAFFKSDS